MESNEKKPKRPRIGENRSIDSEEQGNRFEKVGYNQTTDFSNSQEQQPSSFNNERHYHPRQYDNRQGGYNRYNNGYNRGGGYNNRYNRYNNGNYQPRQHPDYQAQQATESTSEEGQENFNATQQNGYRPRQYNRYNSYNNCQQNYNNGYNRCNGYNNNRQQGGYNRQGGYDNRQGGHDNNRMGGYNNRQQNGYNPQGSYNNRTGGYNNRQQGGYNRQGGYNNRNRQQGNSIMPSRGKSFTPRPKRIEYEMPIPDPNEQIRLNKFMANAGICSRREADEFIQQGLVKVNGNVVTELGTKITHNDVVEYDEKIVALESKCYILLNKPKDCVTTSDDPNGRLTVMDLVKGACTERIYPVGRLDRNTTGVLLLTNDGDLASKLTHPKYVKKKIYHVWCDKDISEEDMQRIADGIELEDGPIHADAISYATETDRNQAGIEIHSGRNRIVRRIFESLGYHVTKLDRVYFAGLTKKNLSRGRWRYLTQEEVNFLKMGSFE